VQLGLYDDLSTAEGNGSENKEYYKKRIEELKVTVSEIVIIQDINVIYIPLDVKLI
jgi:hypothetical protein